ncbi:MAG: phosphoribosyltransferase [Burkholderiales bacterium]|nr:phosphoribosyltransferase [Burkholderiales bacterium]
MSRGPRRAPPPRCELVSWGRFHTLARRLALKIRASGYRPDLIVAIGRGGYMPARVLSDFLDLPDMTGFRIEHYHATRKGRQAVVRHPLSVPLAGRRVLLVDDVTDSGDTFAVALQHLDACGPPLEVRTAVLHHKTVSPYVPDYHAQKVVRWRWIIYPWAVAEDVGGFIRALSPRPRTPEALQRHLAREHGVRLPRRLLLDILTALGGE